MFPMTADTENEWTEVSFIFFKLWKEEKYNRNHFKTNCTLYTAGDRVALDCPVFALSLKK